MPTQADLDAATQSVTTALASVSATILSATQSLEAKIISGQTIDPTTDIAALKAAADGLNSLGSQVQAIANPTTTGTAVSNVANASASPLNTNPTPSNAAPATPAANPSTAS